ncbi:hypothetical protein BH09BAC1_BH09BAC1_30190 [soil metagenome]
MKYTLLFLIAMVSFMGCIKAPNELTPNFWDPGMEVPNIATLLDSSYQVNGSNERYYDVTFNIAWDDVPVLRDDNIISVNVFNNGINIPMQFNSAGRAQYRALFFAVPAQTTCLTFNFITSNGGNTRPFELLCVQVP